MSGARATLTLDEASEKWGVKVTRVEIREIDPPNGRVRSASARD